MVAFGRNLSYIHDKFKHMFKEKKIFLDMEETMK